jgi:glycosyltransferase involved in cell wall biosynthesis
MVAASVSVLIPTLGRPESLARALRSVFAQDRLDLIGEIVVVDNAPDASARETVEALRSASPVALIYLHAEPPGVATARNVGLGAITAPYVAFLDDDEEATPGWIGALEAMHSATGADVTFGPVQGSAAEAAPWKRPYLERFFSRRGPQASGLTDQVFGCGNSMMTRARALKGPAPFSAAADHTGGEDDRLFAALRREGARFAWAADAVVVEHAPPNRMRAAYALARAVSYGQSPTQLSLARGDVLRAAGWVLIGAGQALVFGLGAIARLLMGDARWLDFADRAARGVGKTLWFAHFDFYGRAAALNAGAPRTRAQPAAIEAAPAETAL